MHNGIHEILYPDPTQTVCSCYLLVQMSENLKHRNIFPTLGSQVKDPPVSPRSQKCNLPRIPRRFRHIQALLAWRGEVVLSTDSPYSLGSRLGNWVRLSLRWFDWYELDSLLKGEQNMRENS